MSAATQMVRRLHRAEHVPLALTLLLRALTHGSFAAWVITADPAWFDIFWVGGAYGVADGTLGLLTAFLLERRTPVAAPPALVGIMWADGLMRLGASVAILAFPGIPDIPIVTALFFGALGSWAAVAGAVAVGGWLFAHSHHDASATGRARVRALFEPLSAAGIVALALAAYAIVVGPPATSGELQNYAAVACIALACVFLAAAGGAMRVPGIRDPADVG
jgi:hypothetical protein